jgi:energy-coupling factor transport system permease protein
MKNITLGQYYPINSAVHKMDARIKILIMVAYIVGIFFVKSYFGYVITAAFVVCMILFSKVPPASVIRFNRHTVFGYFYSDIKSTMDKTGCFTVELVEA